MIAELNVLENRNELCIWVLIPQLPLTSYVPVSKIFNHSQLLFPHLKQTKKIRVVTLSLI